MSCARFLARRGCRVSVIDSRAEPPCRRELARDVPAARLVTGRFDAALIDAARCIVISPGVSCNEPALAGARRRGVPLVGDVELFARNCPAPVLAISGSNGKSTVTALVGKILQAAGRKVLVGGNIGRPALELLDAPVPDFFVLELSSFQLESTQSLTPLAATVLNLSADHLDRYVAMEHYAAAKARIFRGAGVMVLNGDDPQVMSMARAGRRCLVFSLGVPGPGRYGRRTSGGRPWLAFGDTPLMPVKDIGLMGAHNQANVLAAMALCAAAGIDHGAMVAAVGEFRGLPHRVEEVAQRAGVRWVNDSKGTNVGATVAALAGLAESVVLIAGGVGKGQDFGPLRDAVARRCRAVILLGEDAPAIEEAIAGAVPVRRAVDMAQAVNLAARLARGGDVVLLSPACASFDMFQDYAQRGEAFKQALTERIEP